MLDADVDGAAVRRISNVPSSHQKATTKEEFSVPTLSETLKKIEELIKEGQILIPSPTSDNNQSAPEQTTGSAGYVSRTTSEPPKVFGRDKEADEIISMLRDDAAGVHSVIGIHGTSGSGKTTLAQYVCERVKKKNNEVPHFDLIMWIHVTENFTVQTVYNEMLEIVSGRPQKEKFSNPDMMQDTVKKELEGKRVLLVLDDVWYPENDDKQDDLVKLLSPLKKSDKASRVLFTSRTADTVKLLGTHSMKISDMDKDESFKMFMHYAFDNSGISDQDRGEFDTVGRQISELLLASPMATKTVGRQLKRRTSKKEDIAYWKDIACQKSDLLRHTTGALWWSYSQLEEHVQQCFAYCSMFPRRHELKRKELVKMWMAQGFVDVDTSKTTSNIETAAGECFEVLLSTSFIQLHKTPAGREYYTIHDLLHELAQTVAGNHFFRTEKGTVDHQIPQDVRHLFIDSDNLGELMKQIVELKSLRTLAMSISAKEITAEDFKRMLDNLKKLRFVHVFLEKLREDVIPECIGKLIHLRYLGLLGILTSGCIKVPLAVTKLYHLQELLVPIATLLDCPHSELADLENLQHIAGLRLSIPHIGRMKWLQTLGGFSVKKEKGYEITQLENLNNIHGYLSIDGLKNVKSKEDARRANLSNKLNVSSLSFVWREIKVTPDGPSSTKQQKTIAGHHQQEVTPFIKKKQEVTPPKPEDILEALHPPGLLKTLSIFYYSGSTLPSWLSGENGEIIEHLEDLSFHDCHGSSSQLKFSKPHPKLHRLEINECSWNTLQDNVKQQLASLEELKIHGCTNIQSLPELPSSLKILRITVCKNIKALPELPSSLKKLVISDYENMQSPPKLPSYLKILEITVCKSIKALPELPPSLEELIISDYENMKSPPKLPSSLKILEIKVCNSIKALPELPPSLEELIISDYKNIQLPPRLPSSLKKLQIKDCQNIKTLLELPSSLEELKIEDCPNIQSPPGLPSSLKKLQIRRCPKIKTLPGLPPSLEKLHCNRDLVDRHPDRQAICRIKIKIYTLPSATSYSNLHAGQIKIGR